MRIPNAAVLVLVTMCLLLVAFYAVHLDSGVGHETAALRRDVAEPARRQRVPVQASRALTWTSTKDEAVSLGGEQFIFRDVLSSDTIETVVNEVTTDYAIIDRIAFHEGDVVLDVGAHVGMVSAYIGRKHPQVKIYALEPARINYRHLVHNLQVNRIDNVIPVALGIGERDGTLRICMDANNTGASRVGAENCAWEEPIEVVDANRIFGEYRIEKVRLLKIDCEGCEIPFFRDITPENLRRIEYITGEVHCENARQEREILPVLDRLHGLIAPEKLSLVSDGTDCQQVVARLRPTL